ncbi:MAG: hypothetical protein HS114_34785 [Anaerolineales bacterium]|nr:hypothetical protein [Anaerolineales bacterium]
MHLKFICPKCQVERRLAERSNDVTIVTSIQTVSNVGELDYVPSSTLTFGGYIECYECDLCSETVVDEDGDPITNSEALAEWLRRQPYNDLPPVVYGGSASPEGDNQPQPDTECQSCGHQFVAERDGGEACPACESSDLGAISDREEITLDAEGFHPSKERRK